MTIFKDMYQKLKNTNTWSKSKEKKLFSEVFKRIIRNKAKLANDFYKRKKSAATVLTSLFILFSQDVNGQNYIPKLELIRNAQIELAEDMDNGTLTREQGWERYKHIGLSLFEFEKQIVQDIEELMQGENFVSARRNIDLFESMIEILHTEDSVLRGYVTDLRSDLESLEASVDENKQSITYACKETIDGEPELQDIEGATYLVCTAQSRDMQMALDKARFYIRRYAHKEGLSINLQDQLQEVTESNSMYRGTVAVGLN